MLAKPQLVPNINTMVRINRNRNKSLQISGGFSMPMSHQDLLGLPVMPARDNDVAST